MNKVVLDEKKCLKNHLTMQEALIALAMSMPNFKSTFRNMIGRGIINTSGSSITPEWSAVLSKLNPSDDEHLQQLASQMKECFPKGRKPGTVYYFRCNEREIILKLRKFFETYGDYTDEQILSATRKFVASFQGDYHLMPLIKYFISKNKPVINDDGTSQMVEVSELASTLENMSDDDDSPEVSGSDDWLMNSRN